MDNFFDVAIVGACNAISIKLLEVLSNRNFPISKLVMFDVNPKTGVLALNSENVIKNHADIAFFCADSPLSKKYAPLFSALGCTVIDCSCAFCLDDSVPLIVPSINDNEMLLSREIIAVPSPLAITTLCVLAPINKKFGLKRAVLGVFQPDCGSEILPNGCTLDEQNLTNEVKKILGSEVMSVSIAPASTLEDIFVLANLRFFRTSSVEEICQTLLHSGMPSEIKISRVRKDLATADGFNLCVSANGAQTAALACAMIAELLI